MITVTFERKKAKIVGFTSKGHAGDNYTDKTTLMVCNWVSATTQMAAIGLDQICHLQPYVQLSEEQALLSVRLNSASNDSEIIMESLHKVLMDLRDLYPKNLEIIETTRKG